VLILDQTGLGLVHAVLSKVQLNSIYEKMVKEGVSQEIIDEFLRISPIAWIHIAFTGQYNFKKSNGDIDIGALMAALEQQLKKHFWKDG